MEQLTQNLKSGVMEILEVPFPALTSGSVLVRNHFSMISAGTEGKTVKDARLGLIGKARSRKAEVKKVIDAARTYGLKDTYRMVMNKLDAPSALGYSCAGEVIAVAEDVVDFRIGDWVACGGSGAVHAEIVAVPVNLCVKVPKRIPLEYAAFTTLGAIALQGIRQADLRLGENAVVIGLGLLGQLTLQMLEASGVSAIGIDLDPRMVELARKNGNKNCFQRNREDLEAEIYRLTNGYGCDAVIITAATSSTDPVDLAGELARKKGKVIIVGNVPTGFSRANYFKKELDLRMSSSYGPGRYDPEYEEKGLDYPYAYVRWTENRNMQAFVELLEKGSLRMEGLLTHRFAFRQAADAYQMILDKTDPFAGIVLHYDISKEIADVPLQLKSYTYNGSGPVVGLIGAGSFGQNFLLPSLKGKAELAGVVTARPNNARNIASKYGFSWCSGDAGEIFASKDINTVFVVTRHDSHAEYVLKALNSDKNIFVEKPLCLNENELQQIKELYLKKQVRLMVGFNRRFAPLTASLQQFIAPGQPMAIHYRINAGAIPAGHWIHDPATGGGRVIGELCHFIDYCLYVSGSELQSLSAIALKDPDGRRDTVSVQLEFENGSTAQLSYFSNGNKLLPKEYIEIFSQGKVAVIKDFQELELYGKALKKISTRQDKGHAQEISSFLNAVKNGEPSPISFKDIYTVTLAGFKVLESIAANGVRIPL